MGEAVRESAAKGSTGLRRSKRRGAGGPGRRLAALVGALLLAAAGAAAQEQEGGEGAAARSYDISAQPLEGALEAFSRQSGVQLLYPSELTEGLQSPGVEGRYTPGEALERLLAGTGLRPRFTAQRTATLEAAADADASGSAESLPPLVVSATRSETPVSELTRSVTLISKEEIEDQKRTGRSVGEIVAKQVPGFSPPTEGLTDFGQTLRGRTFLTLIDGVPQSTPLRDGRRSLNTIDADAIERIEVVRGGTAAYGFGATGGLVNIITKRPAEGELEGHSEAGIAMSTEHIEGDDSLRWHTHHQASGRKGPVDYLIGGSFAERNGFWDSDGDRIPPDPFGAQGGLADSDEWSGLGKLGYSFDGGQQRLELSASYFELFQDTDFMAGLGDALDDVKTPAVRGNQDEKEPGTENTVLNLSYRNEDLLGSKIRSQLYYGDLTTRFTEFPGFPQSEIVSEKLGARLTIDTPVELVDPVPFHVIWGVDYLHDETDQEGLNDPNMTGLEDPIGIPRMEQDAFAGFAELEVPVREWGLLRAGVRHETISVDVDDVVNLAFTPVEGGSLSFNETLFNASAVAFLTDRIELYGGFSQGFSLADLGRVFSFTTTTQADELDDETQKVDNYELGLRAGFERWDASLTGFFSESENGTTFSGANLEIAKQPEQIYGVELAANARPHERVRVGGTATWQEGEIDLDDDGDFDEDLPSTRIPPLKVTGYLEYRPFDWWSLRLQGLFSGDRDPDSSQFGGGEIEDYTVFDLLSRHDVGPGTLVVGIENLFNEDYFPVLNQSVRNFQLPPGASARSDGDALFSQGPGRTVSLTYSIDW